MQQEGVGLIPLFRISKYCQNIYIDQSSLLMIVSQDSEGGVTVTMAVCLRSSSCFVNKTLTV